MAKHCSISCSIVSVSGIGRANARPGFYKPNGGTDADFFGYARPAVQS